MTSCPPARVRASGEKVRQPALVVSMVRCSICVSSRTVRTLWVLLFTLAGCSSVSEPAGSPGARSVPSPSPRMVRSQTGAALDRDFPDPSVMRASNSSYYAYATQVVTGSSAVNIQVARSDNLKEWAYLGDALPHKPSWARTTQSFWAPHVLEHEGTFFMYFSAVPDDAGVDESCLSVATSSSPEGPFESSDKPLLCGYEIDPAVFLDPVSGDPLMYWGSAGDIVVQPMSEDLLSLEGAGPSLLLQGWSSPVRRPYEHGIEGPFVIYRRGWYYLFYSGDRCCEYPPHYALLVARSRRADGGFRRIGGVEGRANSVILSDWSHWAGPGHCSVFKDEAGDDRIACHAIDRREPYLDTGDVRRC